MKPVAIELSARLEGPIDLVWKLLTDWERQGDWMLEASDFVVRTEHREGVGVEADATIRIGGISTRDTIRVDVWDPPTHLGIAHLGWVSGRGDLRMTPEGEHTRIHWREELRPPLGPLGAIGLRLFRPLLARTFRRDLDVLGNIVKQAVDGRYPG
jgi:carbon monoxide dehydrogenase subunit G